MWKNVLLGFEKFGEECSTALNDVLTSNLQSTIRVAHNPDLDVIANRILGTVKGVIPITKRMQQTAAKLRSIPTTITYTNDITDLNAMSRTVSANIVLSKSAQHYFAYNRDRPTHDEYLNNLNNFMGKLKLNIVEDVIPKYRTWLETIENNFNRFIDQVKTSPPPSKQHHQKHRSGAQSKNPIQTGPVQSERK